LAQKIVPWLFHQSISKLFRWYPFKKPGEISEVCVEQENALDSNFGNFLPQNIEMIRRLGTTARTITGRAVVAGG
jgi:hypothetical protein